MYIEIDKRVLELNDSQAFVYMMIVYNKFQHRQINRQYLASALGVTSKDYITEIITAIEKKGLLKRKNYTAHSYNEGWIDVKLDWTLTYEDSYKVSLDFVRDRNISQKVKGFALRYRCICDCLLNDTMNKKSMAIQLNVSRPTLNKYLAYMDDVKQYFYKEKQVKDELTSDEMNTLKLLASKECADGAVKQCCVWFLKKSLYKQSNCRDLFNKAVAGILFNTSKTNETNNSRYSFGG